MPPVLRTIAEWNPISSLVQALRELWGNGGVRCRPTPRCRFTTRSSTLIWSVVITAVLAPLAVRAFRRRTST